MMRMPRSPLLAAGLVSAAIHAGIVTVAIQSTSVPAPFESPRTLSATLGTSALERQPAAPSGLAPISATRLRMTSVRALAFAPMAALPAPASTDGEAWVTAETVDDLARLGDLLERELQFPREVQAPVRIAEQIRARYPAAAAAQGLEGDVLAWVVVDGTANVEEIEIVEGDEAFREAVIDAIRTARFKPAADGGAGLRFPITLEFRFVLPRPGSGPTVAAAATG